MNVRQKELLENYKELLLKAIREALAENKENPYDVTWNTESFLTDYGLFRGVGEYARKRYFKDFTKQLIFIELGERFRLGHPEYVCEAFKKFQFGCSIPEEFRPKPETETKE